MRRRLRSRTRPRHVAHLTSLRAAPRKLPLADQAPRHVFTTNVCLPRPQRGVVTVGEFPTELAMVTLTLPMAVLSPPMAIGIWKF